jgi:DNA-binding MarR family transcriptional regulator
MADPKTNRALKQLQVLAEFRYQLRGFLHFSERVATKAGLRAQQYQLLQVVGSAPKDDLPTIAYVAERMLLRHNSAVELVDRIEGQGLLRRVPDKIDHRRMRLKLSAKGERVLVKLVKEHVAELQRIGPAMRQTLNAVAAPRMVKTAAHRESDE